MNAVQKCSSNIRIFILENVLIPLPNTDNEAPTVMCPNTVASWDTQQQMEQINKWSKLANGAN